MISSILSLASVAVSFFSPTIGKYISYASAAVGLLGVAGAVMNLAIEGVKTVFNQIMTQGLFATIRQGIGSVGKLLMEPVRFIDRAFQKGLSLFETNSSVGLAKLGSGVTQLIRKSKSAEKYFFGLRAPGARLKYQESMKRSLTFRDSKPN